MEITDFYNRHQGETCLIVAVGPNLGLTPPEWFDYPSFSVNSIFEHATWTPDYYVGVDQRLWDENTEKILDKFQDIPIFLPTPDYDYVAAPNLVRFKHFCSSGYGVGGWLPTMRETFVKQGITYQRVMGAVFQIAYYMGFARMLIVGMSHKPNDAAAHYYGHDAGCVVDQPLNHWFDEYRHWSHLSQAVEVLNISAETHVPEDVIARDDWRKWANARKS